MNIETGLPPAIVITAGLDPLAKECQKYVVLLEKAGVNVVHKHYEGLMHDFPMFAGLIDEGEKSVKFIAHSIAEIFKP